jgi:hypothetical protein
VKIEFFASLVIFVKFGVEILKNGVKTCFEIWCENLFFENWYENLFLKFGI